MSNRVELLIDVLHEHGRIQADKGAFIFLDQGEIETERLTFGELDRDARKIADRLLGILSPGDRVLLVYPSGLDFVRAFFGCLYAGVIPIPTNAPGRNRSLARLFDIARDAQATLGISTREFIELFGSQLQEYGEINSMKWIGHNSLTSGSEYSWVRPKISPDHIAFIQYTSGSTMHPRGVMITYHNISSNKDLVRESRKGELSLASVNVHWVPQFHDMGLLLGVVQGVYDGNLSVLMSPIAFIQRPARWLEAITKYKGSYSGGPNFSYELCVRKVTEQELQGLDLSSWKHAYNGAEPIRASTLERFSQKFSDCGFIYNSLYQSYGLAEATLIVSGCGGARRDRFYPAEPMALEEGKVIPCDPGDIAHCKYLVNCGNPYGELKVEIVDPTSSQRCPVGRIGEIWISGESVGKGYWNRMEDTEKVFKARIQGDDLYQYLRTGDLGFMDAGNLYVTGRLKDMIIIRGRNYYPQDIEYTVENSHPAMQPGGGAAFAIDDDGDEKLVILQELRRDYQNIVNNDEIIKSIRYTVAREHGIRASAVILIRRGTIPKTSSGKIMRNESRTQYLNKELDVITGWDIHSGNF
jgi:acyl-CoA synthetase (AMP-forming)/AMP-acid ligase II